MQRLRPLSETECYLRCYGWRGSEDTVRVLPPAPSTGNGSSARTDEALRLAFELRLDERAPEAA